MPEFVHRTPINEAMSWELYKQSLNWELTDRAEAAAQAEHGPTFDELETETRITTEGEDFVVTFTWGDDLPTTQKTRVSFDIITRRAGIAELTAPEGTDLSALLQDHLARNGEALDENNLPTGVTLESWTLEPGEHRLDVDWEEEAA